MGKRTLVIAFVSLLLIIAAPVLAYVFLTRPIPRLSGTESLGGLDKEVQVSFDRRGVPYIEARSDADAYMAQGYITARDRMFQMDTLRRTAEGEMSEIFGSSWLPTDRLMRTVGIRRAAYAEFDKLSPACKAALESYTRGINSYLNTAAALPLQFSLLGYKPRVWRAEDSLAILKYQAYRLDESWRLDDFRQRIFNLAGEDVAAQLFRDDLVAYGKPQQPKEEDGKRKPAAVSELKQAERLLAEIQAIGDSAQSALRTTPLVGSTTWAIPGQSTSTRGAMLACNSDGPLTFPAEFYLCSLNSPGMHVAGATLPGVPCILIGRNENVGWGYSALKADTQDIFLEQFDSEFGTRYKTPDGGKEAAVTTELIPVRFGNDIEHKVLTTTHGPVLLRAKQSAVSLAWTGMYTDKPAFESVYRLNRAESLDAFAKALQYFSSPALQFVFADRWGNVALQAVGTIPVRADGGDGTMLNIGWQQKGTWTSVVPFEKLPHASVAASTSGGAARDPMIAANQAPAAGSSSGAMLGHQWAPPYRANRLLSALTDNTTPVTPADMIALAGDQRSALGSVLATALQTAALNSHLADRNGLFVIELLTRWDTELRPDTIEASMYEAYLQSFTRRLLEPKLGRGLTTEYLQRWPLWLTFAQSVLQNQPPEWLPPEERTFDSFLMTTLAQAMKSLHIGFETNIPNDWIWGKTHTAKFNPLGGAASWFSNFYRIGPVAVGGAPECINSCDVAFDPSMLNFTSSNGPTQRTIIDMSDHSKFYQSLCTGQSGHLFSPYRDDQVKAWASVDLLPVAFSPDQLLKQSSSKLVLDSQ